MIYRSAVQIRRGNIHSSIFFFSESNSSLVKIPSSNNFFKSLSFFILSFDISDELFVDSEVVLSFLNFFFFVVVLFEEILLPRKPSSVNLALS